MKTPRNAGFTLIEILVVVTIIAALVGLATPIIQNAQDKSRAVTCAAHLSDMGKNLFLWKSDHHDTWPRTSGIRFFLVLYRDGYVKGKDCDVFVCPGRPEQRDTDPGDPQAAPGSAYDNWDDIDSTSTGYAGRDVKNFHINVNDEGSELIVADDNEGGKNHKRATNVLYADASVRTIDINADVRDKGMDLGGLEYLEVGPDSPYEPLQKLLID